MNKLLIITGLLAWPIAASAQLYCWQYEEISGPPVFSVVYSSDPNFWADGGFPSPGSYMQIDGLVGGLEFDLSSPLIFNGYGNELSLVPGGTAGDFLEGATVNTEAVPMNPEYRVGLALGPGSSGSTTLQEIGIATFFQNGPEAYESDSLGSWEPVAVPEPGAFGLLLLSLPLLWKVR